ncbi:uncharacterized protein ACWYII_030390 isoform 3-T3 [Salvelinus alpinus]
MTDFGDSLTECDQAEPDFSELSVELKQTEYYTYLSTTSVTTTSQTTERVSEKVSITAEPMDLPLPQSTQLPQASEVVRPKETCEIFSEDHIDEVSHRLYKVLFGYVEKSTSEESKKTPMELDEVAGTYRASRVYAADSPTSMPLIDVDQATLDQETISTELYLRPVDISPMTPESITFGVGKESQTIAQTPSDVSRTTLISESVTVESIVSTAFIQISHDSTAETRAEVSALPVSELAMALAPVSLRSETKKRSLSPDSASEYATKIVVSMHDQSSSPESVTSDDRSRSQSPDSHIPEYCPSTSDSSILLTESRASSPESLSSDTDLSLLLPDSPIPQFRPLSPLPPPEVEWETAEIPSYAPGQTFLSAPGAASSLLAPGLAEAEDRPLTPMVPNRGEFSRAIFPGSEYLEKRALSPESTGSVNEQRPLSPDSPIPEFRQALAESVISTTGCRSYSPESETSVTSETECILLEAFAFWQRPDSPQSIVSDTEERPLSAESLSDYRPMSATSRMLLNDIKASSPVSTGSVDEHRPLSPDSPITQFWQSEPIALVTFCRSSSPESMFSDIDYETAPLLSLLYKDRPSSPESIASIDEYRALSPDSPIPQFWHILPDSIVDYRSSSPESVSSDTKCVPMSLESIGTEHRPDSPEALDFEKEITYSALTQSKSLQPLVSPSVTKLKLPKSTTLVPENVKMTAESLDAIEPNPVMSEPACSTDMQHIHLDIQQSTEKGQTKLNPLSTKTKSAKQQKSKSSKTDPAFLSVTEVPAVKPLSESVLHSTNQPPIKPAEVVTAPKPAKPESTKPESHEVLSATSDVAQPSEDQDVILCVSPITVTESGVNVPESPPILTESTTAPLFEFSQPEPQKILSESDVAQPSSMSPITVSASGIHFPPSAILVPEYRLVYDAELWKLISQINDQQYVGETYCSKTGVFEYAGQRKEYEETSELDNKPLSIDSPVEESDSKPESLSEYRSMSSSSLMLLKDIKTTSPESTGTMDEHRSLSPDSPVPKYSPLFCEAGPFHHRSSSPESLPDYEVSEILDLISVAIEDRPLSPESTGSVSEHSSKDQDVVTESGVLESPQIIFNSTAQLFPEWSKPETQKGLSVPGLAQTPKEPSVSPRMVSDEGIHVPPSVIRVPAYKLKYDAELWKLVSPIHDPQYVGETPKTGMFEYAESIVEYVQTSERESQTSSTEVTEDRPLSSDSESEYRPLTPESVKIVAVLRSDKAESVKSLKACKSLSPDSPVPQYSLFFLETAQSYHRSLSPESVSDAEVVVDSKYSIVLGIDARTSCPESIGSVNEQRPLSPDSPIPEFRQELAESAFSSTRSRSSSPESVTSGTSEIEYILSEAFDFRQNPDSPESTVSDTEERPLSPESLSEYCPMSPESVMLLTNVRSSSPESTASVDEYRCLSPDSPLPQYLQYFPEPTIFMTGSRSSSPASVLSDEEFENELFLYASMHFKDRPSSPDSIASIDEYRALSPESPIPEFRQALRESIVSMIGYRSSSPESLADYETESETEYAPLISEIEDRQDTPDSTTSVDEFRALSPDSPVPQYTQHETTTLVTGNRSASPESICSDMEYETELFSHASMLSENRPSSPDSIASVDEYRALSPDSPIPEFLHAIPECVTSSVYGYRSSSPESGISGTSEVDDILSEAFAFWQRPDSPESTASVDEYRCLSPDSPLPQYFDYFPEATLFTAGSRSSSPASVLSDDKYDLSDIFLTLFSERGRPSSPESVASVDEYMALSPDSPIPDFSPSLSESIPHFIGYRSTSPESMCSDIECGTLPLMSLFYEDRPRSLTSVWSDNECELSDVFSTIFSDKDRPSSEALAFWQRPDSPESIVSDTEERPLSPDSLSEYCPMSPESVMLLTNVRSSSPESTASVDEYRCLSPDSPLPQYLQYFPEPTIFMTGSRSSSPASVLSDEEFENELFLYASMHFKDRPSSPDSIASVDEYRALSPDSPIPEFRQVLPESAFSTIGYRSSSPESVDSDIEYAPLISESFFDENRPDSPESIVSDTEERPLSPDSLSEYCPMSPESVMLLTNVRSSSPESTASVDEYRCLSPDSPLPQYLQHYPEPTLFMARSRSSSPASVLSDLEYETELFSFTSMLFQDRPDSVASVDESRALSPDSPIPEFRQDLLEYFVECRSSSPESVTSDIEYAHSPSESVMRVPIYKLVYDADRWKLISPIHDPQYVGETFASKTGMFEYCGSTIEYVQKSELLSKMLSNESGLRSDSPESVKSMDEHRSLSPDSPIPQYFQYFPEPIMFMAGSRPSSPASVLSDEEFENELFLYASMHFKDRPSSPDSIASIDEYRALSPESPIPEFRQALRESIVSMIGYRSSSPESLAGYETESETEYAPLISEIEDRQDTPDSTTSVDEFRALSPDSPVPQYTQHETTTLVTGNRSASPESICSDMEYETELFSHASMLSENRPSSPDSIASVDEYRALSPDSPIPEFLHAIPECVTSSVYGYRSSSPESGISGTSEVDDILSEAFAFWQRPDSPESTASVDEYRCLSPDSPLPQYFDYFPEATLFTAGSRSSSPASVLSDDKYDLSDIFLTLFSERGRPSSPESVASVDEYMALSPDSPIPDFSPSLSESIPHFIGYRSTSPESMCSDIECGTLPLMSLFYEDRPRSLTSVWSDNECELSDIFSTIFSDKDRPSSEAFAFWQRPDSPESIVSDTEERPLSPESLSEYCPMSPESVMLLTNARSSSPESTASVDEYRCLSPDSPLPQYLQYFPEPTIFMTGSRSSSPASVLSDEEFENELFLYASMHFKDRPSSPDSIASVDEYRALSPESPIPEFRQALRESIVSMIGYRSSSPESLADYETESETEYAPLISEIEDRQDTPDSTTSVDEFRALSPDSPVPQYTQHETTTLVTGNRSASPESICSDMEYETELFSHASMLSENRPSSPDSIASVDEYRALSPDSPIPEFLHAIPECVTSSVYGYRSSSPESGISGTSEVDDILSEAFAFWQRPDSPESTASVDEYRCLSPDSPLPQYFDYFPEATLFTAGSRSSSPASVLSDDKYDLSDIFLTLFSERGRPSSPESVASVDEYMALSPDSPIPDFSPSLSESIPHFIGYRSTSPESMCSDIECGTLPLMSLFYEDRPRSLTSVWSDNECELSDIFSTIFSDKDRPSSEAFAFWQRPDSPESIVSDTEERPLSPDSLSEYCPMSPESVMLLTNVRSSSPESTASVDEYRCLSPDSPLPQYLQYFPEPTIFMTGSRSSSPASVLSDEEFENELFLYASMHFKDRPSSPDSIASVDEYRALSPDSPIPEFRQVLPESAFSTIGYRSSSPESVDSDIEYAPLISESFFDENRPDSPESIVSDTEERPLSPDSLSEYCPMSPESVMLLTNVRSSSPESTASVDEYRCLSPDSPLPQYLQHYPEPTLFMARSRSSSPASVLSDLEYETELFSFTSMLFQDRPDSVASVDESRALSPDSPIPEFRQDLLEYFVECRSSSPESVTSDIEYAHSPSESVMRVPIYKLVYDADRWKLISPIHDPQYVGETFASKTGMFEYCGSTIEYVQKSELLSKMLSNESGLRSDSPESVKSMDEHRSLSPDSPIPQYFQYFPEPIMFMAGSRPSSPDSGTSEEIGHMLSEAFSFWQRPGSPDSIASVDEYRALSPDSPIPEFRQHLPESVTYSLGYRSSSPESVTSDIEYEPYISEVFFIESRPDSPESIVSDTEERPLSPESLSEYCPMSPESVMLLTNVRSSSPESTASVDEYRCLSPDSPLRQYLQYFPEPTIFMTGSRSSSPASVLSDEEFENELFLYASMHFKDRPSSPDSIASIDEYRALSPESPIPEFRQALRESIVSMIGYRSSSPESLAGYETESETEYAPLISEIEDRQDTPDSTTSVDEFRALSPDSPVPQYTQHETTTLVTGTRSASPESICSDMEYETELFSHASMLSENRPSSPDSIASVDEYRALSPDSPIPEFLHAIPECVTSSVYGYRSSSPDSVISGTSEVDDILSEAFAFWQRPDSPESTASVDEYRCLSPDSPLPQYFDYFPEATLFTAGSRSSSPASVLSDDKYDLSDIFLTLFSERGRPSSPESVASVDEYMALSPDSPIPDFSPSLSESIPHFIGYRSTSPESMCSDIECGTLPLMSLFYEDRPRSLTSVWSDNECELSDIFSTIFSDKDRPSSEAFAFWQRPDSPESIVSDTEERPLSPESLSEYCPMSPESVMLLTNARSSSPESTASVDEYRCLSPDSPLPQYLQYFPEPTIFMTGSRSSSPASVLSDEEFENELFLYASMHFKDRPSSPDSIASVDEYRALSPESPIPEFRQALRESIVSMIGYRSSSPESLADYETESETEYAPLISEIEDRQDTPDSTTSVDEFRALSPDSPVPQYTQHETTTLVTGNRSASPESICSDMESETELFLYASMLFENRPSSPDSIASVDEYRALSPDSPIPEFRQVVRESIVSMIGYRSSSPESVASDVEYAPLISESSSVELRPDSPESVASVNGHRSFSPQSPIAQFTQITIGSNTVETGYRSSSPLSITSDMEFDLVYSDIEEAELPTKSLIPEHVSPSEILSMEASEQKPKAASSGSPVAGTAMMVEEYNRMYDTELWKLISQIHDAQYVGETFLSKTGFLEYTGSSEAHAETSPGEEDVAQGNTDVSPEAVPGPQVEPAATTETAKIDQDVALTESIEYVQTSPEEREVAQGSTEFSTEVLPDWQVEPSGTTTETVKIDQDVAPTDSPSVSDIVLPESPAAEVVVSECTFETGHRSASPQSKSDSGDEWVIVSLSETEDTPLSPESLPDCRPISPATLVLKADVRTSSPESVLFEKQVEKDRPLSTESVEYRTMSLESTMSMDKVRSSSPESMHEISDNRSLSPDSPIPQYTRSGVSGMDSWNMEYATIEHRSSSPESMTSGSEYELMVISSSALESRPSSPDSLESVSRNRRLSPDSPVPDFMRILSQYFMEPRALSDRTSSPESVSSDTLFIALPVDSWADVRRRQSSPESGASDEELSLVITGTETMTFKAGTLSHVTSVLTSERVPMSPEENTLGVTLLSVPAAQFEIEQGQMSTTDQGLPRVSGLVAEMVTTSTEQARTKHGSEHAGTIPTPQATMGLENVQKVQKDGPVKPQPVKVQDRSEEEVEVLRLGADSIKTQKAPQRAPSQTAKEIQLKTSYGKMQSKLESTLVTESTLHEQKAVLDLSQETSISGLVSPKQTKRATGYGPLISTPLQISEQYPFTTHRAVTPKLKVLDSATQEFSDWSEFTREEFEETHSGELFSPMSSQFLVPPDYEAVFSGRHPLRVSECSQLSPTDMSPVSPVFSDPLSDKGQVTTTTLMGPEFASKSATPGSAEAFEFSPDFKRVIGEFEKTLSSFGPVVQSDSAQENSDLEFFDCKDDFSDFSEAEDLEPEDPEVLYHIEEPPSPTPFGSTLETGFLKGSRVCSAQFLRVDDQNRFSLGSESLGVYGIYDGPESESETVPTCEELPSRSQAGYDDDEYSLEREINEELGLLSSDSSEEEVLTTRVVRRRVIIQADDLPDIPPQTVTEEQYMDEHGNMVVKKITRKVIRKYFSPDGVEREEVTVEGSHQEMVSVEEGDVFSKVVKRTVVRSEGDQTELTFSEPLALGATTASDFESEQVQGRKVSKVVKTTVVRGERMEKQTGDSTLAADLPSAKEDFEKALSYAVGFGKIQLPHLVEKEVVKDDGSVVKRTQMRKSRTQKRTVVKDAQGKHVHLERLDDTPETLQPDALQQHLHLLLQRYCAKEEEEGEEEEEERKKK